MTFTANEKKLLRIQLSVLSDRVLKESDKLKLLNWLNKQVIKNARR